MIDRKMNSEETFIYWKSMAKELGKARYTATERKEQLDVLCELFFKNDIDIEEAKSYKKKVVEFMITREGMKDSGKYKGWKTNTEEDFLAFLLGYYEGSFKTSDEVVGNISSIRKSNGYNDLDHMARNRLVVAWTKYKFKDKWSESLCLDAHKVGSALWQQFKEEVILAGWSKKGPLPEWFEKIF